MMNDVVKELSSKRILIVEDSEDFQFLVRHLLESEGYHVESAFNGLEALNKLGALFALPHLIILDIMMPVMDGFEFKERIEKDPRLKDIPIVVVTAHGDQLTTMAKIGARDIIHKTADMSSFLEIIKKNCS
jgi:CheY-like chemotaxis protein